MASDPPAGQHQSNDSSTLLKFTVGSSGRTIDLVIPNEEGIRYVATEIFKGKCYQPVPRLPAPRTVLDIGANVGLAAAYFRLIYPDALIHCVEPDPVALSFLVQNAPLIGNCHVHQLGLYEGDCERPFYSASNSVISSVSKNPYARTTPVSIKLRDAGGFVAGLGVKHFDLIKIDTEGSEVPIIRSLGPFIRDAGTIHIEFHSRDDRRTIDDLMNPSHCLFRGVIEVAHRGHFTYVANALLTHDLWEAPLSPDG
jgi:FkbM family methyltransferase